WTLVSFFGALVLGVLMSRTASAQTCPHGTAPVTGTLEVADGSTHDPNEVPLVQAVAAAGVFLQERYGWGSQTFCLGGPPEGMHWVFRAFTSEYLNPAYVEGADCRSDPVTGDATCNGGFTIAVWAKMGNYLGTVTWLPEQLPGGGNVVEGTQFFFSCPVDGEGQYNCADRGDPRYTANNWGVPVGGDGYSEGRTDWKIAYCGPARISTARSSQPTEEDWDCWNEYVRPDIDSCPAAGEPISIVSGNVFVTQQDAVVAGVGTELHFSRTYNSTFRGSGYGVFGAGWHHAYEQRLTVGIGVITLRQPNGVPAYFADPDHDGRFDPSVPFNRLSWIQQQGDGTYRRSFR